MTIVEIKSAKDFSELINSKIHKKVIIFYTAKDCICSIELRPIFENCSKQYKNIQFATLYIDKLKDFEDHVELGTPNFHLYINGRKLEQVIGADEEGLIDLCKKYS
ncbi:unnamed protein product [Brachionus calyciflorus]|uniref:Thioredoxin domain-containing protein n=1 Tax=Brachionus calyciflorus TaxID=104777 RepID=A0A814R1C9_9BILA|nr:unnamed protein product [Brachionus calyciflorus]